MPKASATQWDGVINNLQNKGVKAEEVANSGIKDWLKGQAGQVSKADILDHLKQNRVQFNEIMKGTGKPLTLNEAREASDAGKSIYGEKDGKIMSVTDDTGKIIPFVEKNPEGIAFHEGHFEDATHNKAPGQTKFSDPKLNLPGGTN